jgi:hypothetical protein
MEASGHSRTPLWNSVDIPEVHNEQLYTPQRKSICAYVTDYMSREALDIMDSRSVMNNYPLHRENPVLLMLCLEQH